MPDGQHIPVQVRVAQADPMQPCPCEQQAFALLALFLVLGLDRIKSWWRKRKQPPAAGGDKKPEDSP